MSKIISRTIVTIIALCVFISDLLYFFYNPVKLSDVGSESMLSIILSISAMIAIPGSFFLLYYAYQIWSKNKLLSIALLVISGFYISLLFKSWIETYSN